MQQQEQPAEPHHATAADMQQQQQQPAEPHHAMAAQPQNNSTATPPAPDDEPLLELPRLPLDSLVSIAGLLTVRDLAALSLASAGLAAAVSACRAACHSIDLQTLGTPNLVLVRLEPEARLRLATRMPGTVV